MKRVAFLAVLLFLSRSPGFAQEPRNWGDLPGFQKGIADGKIVEGSTSPNGKYALFECNRWDVGLPTTMTFIGIAPVDRSKLLFVTDSRTEYMTNKKVASFLAFSWNAASSLLATHDSLDRHSKLRIYRLADGTVTSLAIPDLLRIAATKMGAKIITSSGQIPKRWIDENTLEVEVRMTTGTKKSVERIALRVAPDGTVEVVSPRQGTLALGNLDRINKIKRIKRIKMIFRQPGEYGSLFSSVSPDHPNPPNPPNPLNLVNPV